MIEKSPDKSIGWMDMLAEERGLPSSILWHRRLYQVGGTLKVMWLPFHFHRG